MEVLALKSLADSARLAKAEKDIETLYKINEGITYEFQDVTDTGSQSVPPESVSASVAMIGGTNTRFNQLLSSDQYAHGSVTAMSFPFAHNASHHYFVCADVNYNGSNASANMRISISVNPQIYKTPNQNGYHLNSGNNRVYFVLANIITGTTTTLYFNGNTLGTGATYSVDNFMIFDLTDMGISVNTTTTVARAKEMLAAKGIDVEQYYPYDAGSIKALPNVAKVKCGAGTIYITDDIVALCPDYGHGVTDAYNYIDFESKEYHHVGSITDGEWTALPSEEVIDLSSVLDDITFYDLGDSVDYLSNDGFNIPVPNTVKYLVKLI